MRIVQRGYKKMVGNSFFLDIPVYRCTQEKHTKEMEMEKRGLIQYLESSGVPRENAPTAYLNAENHFDRNLWYSWKYNDIIGWIRLFVCGRQLRGEYWWVTSRRIIKRGKKEFSYCGKAFESEDIISEDSNQIFSILCGLLNQLSKERPFKSRYIDMELLLTLGPYINWRELIDSMIFPPRDNK